MSGERTLAEILGWMREEVPDLDGGFDVQWKCPDGCMMRTTDPPSVYCSGHVHPWPITVDDMLGWLRESRNGWHLNDITPGSNVGTPTHSATRPSVALVDPHGHQRWFHANTLCEALAKGVRAVAAGTAP